MGFSSCGQSDGKGVLKPKRTRKAAMRDEPMETKIDSKNAEHIHSDGKSDDPGPAEEPGKKRQRRKSVTENKSDKVVSFQFHRVLIHRSGGLVKTCFRWCRKHTSCPG